MPCRCNARALVGVAREMKGRFENNLYLHPQEPFHIVAAGDVQRKQDMQRTLEEQGIEEPVHIQDVFCAYPMELVLSVCTHPISNDVASTPEFVDFQIEYVKNGGRILLGLFSHMQQYLVQSAKFLPSYHCFSVCTNYHFEKLQLGIVHQPLHPAMANVSKVEGYVTLPCQILPGAELIAQYSNGDPLVAERKVERGIILQVNFSIPSKRSFSNYFDPDTTDMAIMIGNIVRYCAHGRKRLNMGLKLWNNYKNRSMVDVSIVW